MASRMDKTLGNQGKDAPPMADDSAPVSDGQALAQWSTTVDIDITSLPTPWLSLQQGLSKAVTAENSKVVMGDWYSEGYEPLKSFTFIPLLFGLSRNYSTQDSEGELVQHCYSPSGAEHGIAIDELGPGIACAGCKLREWQPTDEVKNGRKVNRPPACKVSYDFQGYVPELEGIFKLGFRSTSEQTGAKIAMLCKNRGLGNVAVEIGSERASNGRFTYAKAKMTITEPTPEMISTARDLLALPSGYAPESEADI